MARNRPRGRALRLITVLSSAVLSLLLLEAIVRLAALESASYSSISGFCRYDPHLGWTLIPENRTVFKGRHFEALVETSSQGLRDRQYPLRPEPGRERILVLGDSVAWCWGVPIEDCFTKRVEAGLSHADVITMGVPGYSTAQALLFYERFGRRFHPDRVLFVAYGNDVRENLDGRKRPRFVVENGEPVLTNHPVPRRKSRVKEWLRNHSRLFIQLDHAAQVGQEVLRRRREGRKDGETRGEQGSRRPYEFADEDEREEAWTLLEALLVRFQDGAIADGARFDIVTFEYTDWFMRRFEEFCAERGCRLLDFDPILRQAEVENRPVLLRGDPHLSAEGNRILADAVLEFLDQPPVASPPAIR